MINTSRNQGHAVLFKPRQVGKTTVMEAMKNFVTFGRREPLEFKRFVIVDTHVLMKRFLECMAMCEHVDYDIDEYASVFLIKLNNIIGTTGEDDLESAVMEVENHYQHGRSVADSVHFHRAFFPLFLSIAQQLTRLSLHETTQITFEGWKEMDLTVSIEAKTPLGQFFSSAIAKDIAASMGRGLTHPNIFL